MRKLAFLGLLSAAVLFIWGCGNNPAITTAPNASWETTLSGGTGNASLLNFVTVFSINNNGQIQVSDLTFLTQGNCFVSGQQASGTTTLTTTGTSQVSGPFSFAIASGVPQGNTLAMTGTLTGNSSGNTTTNGTLSNGIVTGTWTLTGGSDCTGNSNSTGVNGSFIMCENEATCTPPA